MHATLEQKIGPLDRIFGLGVGHGPYSKFHQTRGVVPHLRYVSWPNIRGLGIVNYFYYMVCG